MKIKAIDVKRLRDLTGAGMMDCKRVLGEANGDIEEAIVLLRKKGQKIAAKRSDKDALQGLVVTRLNGSGHVGIMVEVNSETDFVARNKEFEAFASVLADLILKAVPANLAALMDLPFREGRSVAEALLDLTGKIGEKLAIRRFVVLENTDGLIVNYDHPGSRLGVLVDLSGTGDLEDIGRDVAMQIAALNPVAIHRDDVPPAVKDKELEIGRDLARNEGKPERILDHIAKGRVERYLKDNVLMEQQFVKDASLRVKDMLKRVKVTVNRYDRFALGD